MLRDIPIVRHLAPEPTAAQFGAIEPLALDIRRERGELAADSQFHSLSPESLVDGACLHLDDLSEIFYVDQGREFQFMQDRARLRAGDGDLVASAAPEVAGYEEYCQTQLGLGAPEWLRPAPGHNALRIAHACWRDRHMRRTLLHRLRTDAMHYLHPHMGTFGVWELGVLLREHSRRPVKVVAAPPALSKLVNNKVAFADVASRLLGKQYVPTTASAWNMATLCQHAADIADSARMIGLKQPASAGGDAIVVFPADLVRGRSLHEIHESLGQFLPALHWNGASELLIDSWETDVLCSPSTQLWIPPDADGPPVVEGIFAQQLDQEIGMFVGAAEAELSPDCVREITTCSWLLARLFQKLGYVGRCSFDTILVGESLQSYRLEFVECNGRWGGTSLPMTLLNRLFNDWKTQPYAVRVLKIEGLSRVSFPRLLQLLGPAFYDRRSGAGRLIAAMPGRLQFQSAITILALGDSREDAADYLHRTVPVLLKQAVECEAVPAESDDDPSICSP